ncbi:MAG: DUF2339 domain-containing protein [Chitinophagaceae bacterium]|nr:MAG: DUF2339 domain-containing protein [Chitinophagaceae bacterium]
MKADDDIGRLDEEIRILAARQMEDRQRLQALYTELNRLKSRGDVSPMEAQGTGRIAAATGSDTGVPGHVNPDQGSAGQGAQHGLEQFIGLKLIHLAGIVVLLIGISIGVKYAIDQDLVSPMARILLAYGAALLLFILSFRLRTDYRFFSAILFSGSMAAAYFTSYAALAYYNLVSIPVAFAIMAALTAFTIYRSIYYNRIEIAVIGLVGAYGIPFLVSNTTGRIEMFFGYVLLINAGVVFLAARKGWRAVSTLASGITWCLFTGWLVMEYNSVRHYSTAIIYGVLFYLLFLADAISPLFFSRRTISQGGRVLILLLNLLLLLSMTLVFARPEREPVAETAFVFGIVFLQAGIVFYFLKTETALFRMLVAQALCLLVLLAGLAWDGIVVTGVWILLSVVVFVIGVLIHHSWLRLFAVILIGGTLLKLVTLDAMRFTAGQRILSYIAIGSLLLLGSFYYQRFNRLHGTMNTDTGDKKTTR